MVAFGDVYQKSGASSSSAGLGPCPMGERRRHFPIGIDGLSSDDHQLETIILRTNLLTAGAIRGRMIELASYIGTINWR